MEVKEEHVRVWIGLMQLRIWSSGKRRVWNKVIKLLVT
jgi:hypothetical protein